MPAERRRIVVYSFTSRTEADVARISDAPVVIGELIQDGILERYVPPQFVDRVPPEHQGPYTSRATRAAATAARSLR